MAGREAGPPPQPGAEVRTRTVGSDPAPGRVGRYRTGVRVVADVVFPDFREEDRSDMGLFITEFNRVAQHAAGGGTLSPQEWINMMLNSCGRATTAGRALRVLQRTSRYRVAEDRGSFEGCLELVRQTLMTLQRRPFVRTTRARERYDQLRYIPGHDVVDYR